MPGYIPKALHQFQHKAPKIFTFTLHPYTPPTYRFKVQMAKMESTELLLNKKDNTKVRQVLGKLLLYARAINKNLLMGLNKIASQQENATERTGSLVTHILNYCATYPDAVLIFDASNMILHIHTDASFLSESKEKAEREDISSCPISPKIPPKTCTTHQYMFYVKFKKTCWHQLVRRN